MIEDEDKRRSGARTLGAPLDGMSLEELERFIGALEDEIARARAAIAAKTASRAAADAFFKKPGG